ncbi:hypothetical protein M8J77_005275 [Diaphorina citri]|nr:hypothetical protein M8J77_005275 [Diaphorina citri]
MRDSCNSINFTICKKLYAVKYTDVSSNVLQDDVFNLDIVRLRSEGNVAGIWAWRGQLPSPPKVNEVIWVSGSGVREESFADSLLQGSFEGEEGERVQDGVGYGVPEIYRCMKEGFGVGEGVIPRFFKKEFVRSSISGAYVGSELVFFVQVGGGLGN